MTCLIYGPQGTVTADDSTVDLVVGAMQAVDPNYIGSTDLGSCGPRNVPCDCLRCEHGHITRLQYTLNGQACEALVFRS